MRSYFVYIMSTPNTKVLYTGVTNSLERRVYEHKMKLIPGFTQKYNLSKLVYYQEFSDIEQAIAAEKRIKGWTRIKKNTLIMGLNPKWRDLAEDFNQILLR